MKQVFLTILTAVVILSACEMKKNDTARLLLTAAVIAGSGGPASAASRHDWTLMSNVNTARPAAPVQLVFIHHSVGHAWLSTGAGNLGAQLNANNYYVTECYYGWSAAPGDNLGDHTDTSNWPDWFNDTKMPYVYASILHAAYTNTIGDPVGENEIIMFKSCYPNSDVGTSIDDEKNIYNGLLAYFGAHTNKMFVLIVPPPMRDISNPLRTRELANWLVNTTAGWLSTYNATHKNVYVFDYYNVLTDPLNHHRVQGTVAQHFVTDNPTRPYSPDELYYPGGDDHPSSAGHQKATAEFVPLLNVYYNNWKGL